MRETNETPGCPGQDSSSVMFLPGSSLFITAITCEGGQREARYYAGNWTLADDRDDRDGRDGGGTSGAGDGRDGVRNITSDAGDVTQPHSWSCI